MELSQSEVELVRSTWGQVAPQASEVAALFYGRLFETNPRLRRLFPDDMESQGQKLTSTIALAVASLDRPDGLVEPLQRLGARHVGYGVHPGHYAVVGETLLWTLDQGLGEDFTPEAEAAWTKLYGWLAATMQQNGRVDGD